MKDLARVRDAFVSATQRNLLDADEVIASIEQDHTQRFLTERAQFRPDQFIYDLRRIDFLFRPCFARKPLAEPKCCDKLHGLGKANPPDFCQFIYRATAQSSERTVFFEQFACNVDCVSSDDAGAKKNRDQFWIAER